MASVRNEALAAVGVGNEAFEGRCCVLEALNFASNSTNQREFYRVLCFFYAGQPTTFRKRKVDADGDIADKRGKGVAVHKGHRRGLLFIGFFFSYTRWMANISFCNGNSSLNGSYVFYALMAN